MTATRTLVELDEQTKDELQPPCDAGKVPCHCGACNGAVTGRHRCDKPATRVCSSPCSNAVVICCERHAWEVAASGCTCGTDCVVVTPL